MFLEYEAFEPNIHSFKCIMWVSVIVCVRVHLCVSVSEGEIKTFPGLCCHGQDPIAVNAVFQMSQ